MKEIPPGTDKEDVDKLSKSLRPSSKKLDWRRKK